MGWLNCITEIEHEIRIFITTKYNFIHYNSSFNVLTSRLIDWIVLLKSTDSSASSAFHTLYLAYVNHFCTVLSTRIFTPFSEQMGSKVSKDLTKRSMWSKSTFSWYKTSEVNKLHHSASKTIFSSLATMSEMKVKLFNVKSLLSKWFWVARNRILKAPRTCNFSTLSGLPLVKADNANTNRLNVLKIVKQSWNDNKQ